MYTLICNPETPSGTPANLIIGADPRRAVTATSIIGKEGIGRVPAGHGRAVEIYEVDYLPAKFSCCQLNKYRLPNPRS